MTLIPEQVEQPKPREVIFKDYGVYLVTDQNAYPLMNEKDPALENSRNIVMVSQPDWLSTRRILESDDFGRTTVLTPELITIAGEPFEGLSERKEEIERELEAVSSVSRRQPEAVFIIGSPYFDQEHEEPFNSAIAFKNGQIAQIARKKLLSEEERNFFSFDPQDSPAAIEDATLLVCRDLIGAQKTRLIGNRNGVAAYVRQVAHDDSLAKRFENTEFIAPGSRRLLVEACWGIGMPSNTLLLGNHSQKFIDQYYILMLQMMSRSLLEGDPDIDQIIVCDRAPLNVGREIVSSKPMSAVFFKK